MSTLVAPSHTVVDKIPLGQRITEIMKEKGGYFSISAMSKRLGIDRDTYRKMLKGERPIYTFELDRISNDLKVPVDRILQEDIINKYEELKICILQKNTELAMVFVEQIISISIGVTEMCEAQYTKAQIYYERKEFNKSHEVLLIAYNLATNIAEKHGSQEKLNNVLNKLMITSTMRKEYTNLSKILDHIEKVFESDPKKLGSIYFSKAMVAENLGDLERTKDYLNKSLEFFRATGNQSDIGRAILNLGYFEFKSKNYFEAKSLLSSAINQLESDDYYKMIAIKEYVKALIKLGETNEAIKLIRDSLDCLDDVADLKGKFLILYSVSTNKPIYAESVLHIPNVGKNVLGLSCRFLMIFYRGLDDSESYMRYSKMADEYLRTNSDLIHEEDL